MAEIKIQQLILYPCNHKIAVYSNQKYSNNRAEAAHLGCPICTNLTNLPILPPGFEWQIVERSKTKENKL